MKQEVLTKLAIRNVKRSIRDYMLYVITITLIVALMFAFNCMMFSDLILGMNSHMDEYRTLLVFFSIIVLGVVAWLINYMTKFMLEKRSKEFGTYLILGMENRDVSKMFFYENLLLGFLSLVAGVFAGKFIFQGLLAVVTSFFGEEYRISHHLNISALLLTVLYYTVIQLIVVARNKKYLEKLKIYDLINASRINENVKIKHVSRNVFIFFLAIVSAVVSVVKTPIIVTIIAIVLFIYGFYMGLSGILVLIISKAKKFKYKGMNLFIFRQLASKINTMGFTMGTIAVLFTLALLSSNYAIGLGNFKSEIEKYTPFDICLTSLDQYENFEEAREMLLEYGWIKDEILYRIYRSDNDVFNAVLKNNEVSGGYFKYDTYMKVSDYNTLRSYLGLDLVKLGENEFIIHCASTVSKYYNDYVTKNPLINIDEKKYTCQKILDEDFAQNGQNGAGYIIVVPDETVEKMEIYYSQYVCETLKETNDELYVKLQDYIVQDAEIWASSAGWEGELDHGMGIDSMYMIYDNIMVKNGGLVAEVEAAIITVVVSIFYIALVFICVALTILAIQQLSDSTKYKFRYSVLDSLGVDDAQKSKLIFKQLLIYFGCPVIIPLLISLVISIKINQLLLMGTQIQAENYSFFSAAILVFLLVYSIYFFATYIGFKRNVDIN